MKQFTVRQERGQDSLVEISQDFQEGYPNDKKILIFESAVLALQ